VHHRGYPKKKEAAFIMVPSRKEIGASLNLYPQDGGRPSLAGDTR
jgi:hypothetical protein